MKFLVAPMPNLVEKEKFIAITLSIMSTNNVINKAMPDLEVRCDLFT